MSADEKLLALRYAETAGGKARGREYTGKVELRDMASGELLETLALDTVLEGMAFSPKGGMLAAGGLKNAKMDVDTRAVWLQGQGGVVRIWEVRNAALQPKK